MVCGERTVRVVEGEDLVVRHQPDQVMEVRVVLMVVVAPVLAVRRQLVACREQEVRELSSSRTHRVWVYALQIPTALTPTVSVIVDTPAAAAPSMILQDLSSFVLQ